MPELNPFTHNGQLNIQQMAPGEEAELDLTFYSGMSYRLLICCQDAIGKAQFQVFDNKNKLVFILNQFISRSHLKKIFKYLIT